MDKFDVIQNMHAAMSTTAAGEIVIDLDEIT
jgi:hypothetical protein